MRPRVDFAAMKETKAWEHALRFVFGGLVTVGVGLIAHRWGPIVGGLFLGFPSIFPASITMVKRHDGRTKAADQARGAAIGCAGLAAFGWVVEATAGAWSPVAVLAAATGAWLGTSLALWAAIYAWRRE